MPYIVERDKVVPVNINTKYNSKPLSYQKHDLNSVYIHWDPELYKNVPTPNKLPIENKLNNDGGINKDE